MQDIDFTQFTKEDPVLEEKVIKLIDGHLSDKFEDLSEGTRELAIKLTLSTVIPNIVNRLMRGE